MNKSYERHVRKSNSLVVHNVEMEQMYETWVGHGVNRGMELQEVSKE
jgi:hypothetical protein